MFLLNNFQLKFSIKKLNDDRVKNDCIVNGLKVAEGATAVEYVIDLHKQVGVEVRPENINEAYFIRSGAVGNKSGKEVRRSIIVKFSSKSAKDKLMSVKPKLKENENTKNVFINDFLSRETLNLLKYARALKQVGFLYVYAKHGKVFYKRSEISKPQIINSEEDVDNLLMVATAGKPWVRRSMALAAEAEDHETSDDEGDQASYVSPQTGI